MPGILKPAGAGTIQVVRGNPADDELAAAVIAVLVTLAAARDSQQAVVAPGQRPERWAARPDRMTPAPAGRGRGVWRGSAWG